MGRATEIDATKKYVLTETIYKFRCQRCGHIWEPRTGKEPVKCPRCQKFDWRGDTEED